MIGERTRQDQSGPQFISNRILELSAIAEAVQLPPPRSDQIDEEIKSAKSSESCSRQPFAGGLIGADVTSKQPDRCGLRLQGVGQIGRFASRLVAVQHQPRALPGEGLCDNFAAAIANA